MTCIIKVAKGEILCHSKNVFLLRTKHWSEIEAFEPFYRCSDAYDQFSCYYNV